MAPDHEVIIVGAGFSGIGTAIKLDEAGIGDFLILEQADDVGGTWRANTYPGLAVDIPSLTYQFSFEMNPDWSRVFAPGAEVKAYADHCVDKYGLRPRLRLSTRVEKAVFDEDEHVWRVHLGGGEVVTARHLVSALGVLTQPKAPDIPGLGDFAGKTMHTAEWDHDHDLHDRRVAIIGTGATAVQLVPRAASWAQQLYVFQRTPIWVFPKLNLEIPWFVRWLYRHVPGLQNLVRLIASAAVEVGMTVGVAHNRQLPFITRAIERFGRGFLRRQIPDPVLREKLTPKYGFGCKRPSMSNHYHRSFLRDDTELVTEPIERVTASGIRTTDGKEREVDTLVLATGYLVTDPENVPPIPIVGRGGVSLGDFWQENRFQTYEGTTVPGFPNAYSVFAPYALTGSSWMFMIEYQAHHIVRVITESHRRGATLAEVRREPHERFFADTLRRQQNTVFFNNRCGLSNSYYFDKHGDAPFLRPATAIESWWRSKTFDLDHYRYETVADGTSAKPGSGSSSTVSPNGSSLKSASSVD